MRSRDTTVQSHSNFSNSHHSSVKHDIRYHLYLAPSNYLNTMIRSARRCLCEGVLWQVSTRPRLLSGSGVTVMTQPHLGSVQHEAPPWSRTHREGATPARFGPRPRNRDRLPSFSRMALQKEMNREISRVTEWGTLLFLLLLCSSVFLVAPPPHLSCYPFSDLLSFSLQSLLLSSSVIESWNALGWK